MSKGINKAILVGNLGNDPEVRYASNGAAIANISIATSESWKDKNTGEQVEKTEWHRVVLFNKLGEVAGNYLKKGSKVYIEGKLQTRKWQDNAGQDKYTTEIVASEMQMLDSRGDGGQQGGQNQQGGHQGRPANNQAQNNNRPQQAAPVPRQAPTPSTDFDDDIPF